MSKHSGNSSNSQHSEDVAVEAHSSARQASRSLQRRSSGRYSATEWDRASGCGDDDCEHGFYTGEEEHHDPPQNLKTRASSHGAGGPYPGDEVYPEAARTDSAHMILGDAVADGLLGNATKTSTTDWLAKQNGVKHSRMMYVTYYFPFLNWIMQYRWGFLVGDLTAALTICSFYIPMSLSYATNLGHLPAVSGMLAFVFNPMVYAFFGTCPQMVIGPEAAGSLLTGNVVRDSISKGQTGDNEALEHAKIASVVTGAAGAVLLIAGVTRLGFLDNVLSRPFLRGFISAVGVVIFIDQLIAEMGLTALARAARGVEHGSSLDKLMFVFGQAHNAHALTCAVSFGSFVIIMVCREVKKRLQIRFPLAAYVPDRFTIVLVSTLLCWKLRWDQKGLAVLGDVQSNGGSTFKTHFPFDFSHMKHLESALTTSFIIALLGFFESSVAAKSLGTGPSDGINNMSLSANRELVSLGLANIVGGIFMSLPAFGGYGRSKVNVATGGKTPMVNVFVSLITLLCVLFLLPAFHYIPKGVLAAMISAVAWSLIEEAPHDLHFFWKIRGWSELFLITLVFAATIFYSLSLGIALGIGFSLLRVVRHATRPRIQILGRVTGSEDEFENAESDPGRLEFIEHCLIVKIPEPLTFANVGDLRSRLKRLEAYGTSHAHPALPKIRDDDNNKNIIFDVHGVTSLDGAGALVLSEILDGYKKLGVRIFFCRVPNQRSQVWKLFESSGIVDICGGPRHFVGSVREALRMSELESLTEYYCDHPLETPV